MTIAEQSRRNYEIRPYPATDRRVLSGRLAYLPPLAWVQALGRPGGEAPRRVLVAGCGTGAEAFELRRALPNAKIVAVDFSPRSIAIARRLQSQARLTHPVQFAVADLTDAQLAAKTGGNFDFISCHGVLSYIPNLGRVFAHLAACLQPGGVLYLGVNGAGHASERLRRWLTEFGLRVDRLRDERRLRELLRLWDALHPGPAPALAGLPVSYLAGDVCGNHFNNWGLARWRDTARRAGWHLAASWALPVWLRQTLAGSAHRPLFPMKPGELLARLDAACPAPFHRLLFCRAAPTATEWDGSVIPPRGQLRWTGLYRLQLKRPRRGNTVMAVLRCPIFNLRLDWPLNLRAADLVENLARSQQPWTSWPPGWGRTEAARRMLWLWAGFGVIALRPTGSTSRRHSNSLSR